MDLHISDHLFILVFSSKTLSIGFFSAPKKLQENVHFISKQVILDIQWRNKNPPSVSVMPMQRGQGYMKMYILIPTWVKFDILGQL